MGHDENRINNEHDVGYRYLFKAKRVFLQLIRSFIKEEWVNHIDETSLQKVDKSFVLQDFQEKEADIVYSMTLNKDKVYLYVLLELQSSVDYSMPFRLLLYMNEIWRDYIKDIPKNEQSKKTFRLPVIIPIVLYNGKNKWTAPLEFKDYLNESKVFKEQVPNYRYTLLDINSFSKEMLLESSNLISSLFYLDQKAENSQQILDRINELVHIIKYDFSPEDTELFWSWVINILSPRLLKAQSAELEKLKKRIKHKEVYEMISGLEENLKRIEHDAKIEGKMEGRIEGKMEGRIEGKLEVAKNLIKLGVSLEMVKSATNLSDAILIEIKEELKQN